MTNPQDKVLPRLEPDEVGQLGDELAQLRDLILRGDDTALAGGPTMACWSLRRIGRRGCATPSFASSTASCSP